ncbi:hypothetical protein EG68_08894 [Paragonimus skrjabini miyazakii]|uniref:Uncharacterized protein n=1 Tax=Paragonimus skrjabini miyazakii TaxID=59628 RepID=A0A8S9YFA1_9TREM|nr:hypothetical protein EG68_08894 [Paragonimus skrjabini miyazakii]
MLPVNKLLEHVKISRFRTTIITGRSIRSQVFPSKRPNKF